LSPPAPTKVPDQGQKLKCTQTGAPPKSTRHQPLPRVPKKPEPGPPYPLEAIKWAKSMLNQPSQYELNKDDDYTSTL
jgi:hypothetical protein